MMKKYTLIVATILCICGNVMAQSPDWQWARTIGGPTNDIGRAVATDLSGNIFAAGSYEGTIDFDPGPGVSNLTSLGILDGYVMKLDPNGNFLWAISIGGTHTDVVYSIAADHSGNVVVTGRYGNSVDFDPGPGTSLLNTVGYMDMYVAKYSASGSLMWAVSMGGVNDDQCLAIALDAAGNIYGTGYFEGTCDFDPSAAVYSLTSNGLTDAFVFKLEAAGGFIWAKSFGGNLSDAGSAIALDGAANVYTTGYYNGMIDMDPGTGTSAITPFGGSDIYVSKLDVDGDFIWAKPLGGNQTDMGRSIYADAAGNVYSSGDYRGTGDFDPGSSTHLLNAVGDYDFYLSKLNSAGNYNWSWTVGFTDVDNNYAMAADTAGNIYISGFFRSVVDFNPTPAIVSAMYSAGGNDAYITKYDTAGNFTWAKSIGQSQSDIAYSIAVDNTNHLVVTGAYMSAFLVFDTDTIFNVAGGAGADIFIAKLDTTFLSSTVEVNPGADITIHPNPSNAFVVIGNLPETQEETEVMIMDISGKMVYHKTVSNQSELPIDTRFISNGVYMVRVQSQSFLKTTRLIINH